MVPAVQALICMPRDPSHAPSCHAMARTGITKLTGQPIQRLDLVLRPREKRLAIVAAREAELCSRQRRIRRPLFHVGHPRDELQAVARRRSTCDACLLSYNKLITSGGIQAEEQLA